MRVEGGASVTADSIEMGQQRISVSAGVVVTPELTIDHVIPATLGGQDVPENLVTACAECNSGKSAVPPGAELVADVATDALRWSRALQVASRMAAQELEVADATCDAFFEYWQTIVPRYMQDRVRLPLDWRTAVAQWTAAGLTLRDLQDCIDIATSRRRDNTFGYLSGVASNKISALHTAARQLIDNDEV